MVNEVKPAMLRFSTIFFCILISAISISSTANEAATSQPPEQSNPTITRTIFVKLDGNLSFLGEMASQKKMVGSAGYQMLLGFRRNEWDFFIHAEHGFWRDDVGKDRLLMQIFNLGLGIGKSYFSNHMRCSFAIGTAILLTQSQTDPPGTTGIFFDIRPSGFRWKIGKRAVVELQPITFAFVAPVLTGIPLVYISYRTVLSIEFDFPTGDKK